MKKFLSIILALAMVACMSVTAFAADGTTVLTVEVPDNTPTYTLHVPANMTLEYGNTDKQSIGNMYVTDVNGCEEIDILVKYTNLINQNNSTDEIPLVIYNGSKSFDPQTGKRDGYSRSLYSIIVAGLYQFDANGYATPEELDAQVSDWTGATAGATYKATITYVVDVSYV